MEIIIIINKKLLLLLLYIISFTFFFSYFHHKNNGNIHNLVFNKEKYRFVIEYKVIILTIQGKCTNCTISV